MPGLSRSQTAPALADGRKALPEFVTHCARSEPKGQATPALRGVGNLEEFTERHWLTLNPGPVHYPY
jgi:hypothetical protein